MIEGTNFISGVSFFASKAIPQTFGWEVTVLYYDLNWCRGWGKMVEMKKQNILCNMTVIGSEMNVSCYILLFSNTNNTSSSVKMLP